MFKSIYLSDSNVTVPSGKVWYMAKGLDESGTGIYLQSGESISGTGPIIALEQDSDALQDVSNFVPPEQLSEDVSKILLPFGDVTNESNYTKIENTGTESDTTIETAELIDGCLLWSSNADYPDTPNNTINLYYNESLDLTKKFKLTFKRTLENDNGGLMMFGFLDLDGYDFSRTAFQSKGLAFYDNISNGVHKIRYGGDYQTYLKLNSWDYPIGSGLNDGVLEGFSTSIDTEYDMEWDPHNRVVIYTARNLNGELSTLLNLSEDTINAWAGKNNIKPFWYHTIGYTTNTSKSGLIKMLKEQ